MKTIALCMNTPGMDGAQWTLADYGKRYPGAGWMKWLPMLGDSWDALRFVDGKNCLENGFNPKDVIVVQEELNPYGMELVKHGADPRVLLCLESPIFTPNFYDNVLTNFKHRLLFDDGTEHIYFPSFDDDDLKDPVPWDDRKFLCMVTSNKHYSMLGSSVKCISWSYAMETQLHDYRYAAINYFANSPRAGFQLYGRGWHNPNFEIKDKLATILNYKFSLCFENGSYPGYVTEKIIDCLVAGVVPIYMGATDVDDWIPPELFIDARQFKSFQDMEDYLRSEGHRKMSGHTWLTNGDGQLYNNRVFAKRILELCA